MEYSLNLGERIRAERKRRELTLRDTANLLNMDYTMLYKIEAGQRLPRSYIPSIAEFLHCSMEEVVLLIRDMKTTQALRQFDDAVEELPLQLTSEEIEQIALNDRKRFLKLTGKQRIDLPQDREKIVKVLFGLQVIYSNDLFKLGMQLFGALFAEGHFYHGADKAIVITEKRVKALGATHAPLGEETKTFHIFHEAGHYKLHHQKGRVTPLKSVSDIPIYCSSGARNQIEKEANHYAAAFLIPREELIKCIGGSNRVVNLAHHGKGLRKEFFVTGRTLELRLRALGIRYIG